MPLPLKQCDLVISVTETIPGTAISSKTLPDPITNWLGLLMVTLRDVTAENWRACIRLSLHDHQVGYVASNVGTIAESKFNLHFHMRAIYADDSLVGMLAFCHEDDPEDLELFWIFRLMIDRHHQGNGYGIDAMRLAIEQIRKLGATRVRTMHKPENSAAAAIYAKLGFRPAGELDDGDCLLELDFPVTDSRSDG